MRVYGELVELGLMRESGRVASDEQFAPTYEATEKGRRWYSVFGTKTAPKPRRRKGGFWALFGV
jgi:hypothetical protein